MTPRFSSVVGWRACVWLFSGRARRPSLFVFLLRRLVRVWSPSVFLFVRACFFFQLLACFPLFALFCSCLRYFVLVNGGLCPFIFQGFLFHLVDLLGVFVRKQDVVTAVAAQVTMTPRDVRAVLAGIDMVVGEAVMRGEDVTLGFVKFEPVTLPPRVQRLPSGELKELGERRRVKARPCKSLRDRVAGESADED